MNRVRKLSIVFIMTMLITCISTNKTYAALNGNVNLSTSKDKVTYEEQFYVYTSISNLQTTNGIIAIGAVVSYDTDSLTLDSIEGQNKWSDPFYNASNGKMTSFRNELSTKNEDVFKITFKVKEKGKAKNSAWIRISDFEISDGEEEKNCGGSYISIKIEEQDSTNMGDNNQGDNNQENNNNQQQTTEPTTKPTTKPNTKPGTGTTKPTGNNATNIQEGNTNNEVTSNDENNVGNVENTARENIVNNENKANKISNIIETNIEETKENKTMNKGLFYTISTVAVIAIIVISFVVAKYWKTK